MARGDSFWPHCVRPNAPSSLDLVVPGGGGGMCPRACLAKRRQPRGGDGGLGSQRQWGGEAEGWAKRLGGGAGCEDGAGGMRGMAAGGRGALEARWRNRWAPGRALEGWRLIDGDEGIHARGRRWWTVGEGGEAEAWWGGGRAVLAAAFTSGWPAPRASGPLNHAAPRSPAARPLVSWKGGGL